MRNPVRGELPFPEVRRDEAVQPVQVAEGPQVIGVDVDFLAVCGHAENLLFLAPQPDAAGVVLGAGPQVVRDEPLVDVAVVAVVKVMSSGGCFTQCVRTAAPPPRCFD